MENTPKIARNRNIYNLFRHGAKMGKIAEIYHITTSRVWQIVTREERRL